MHNAWITTSGEKMSKSLGNSLVISSVLQQVRAIELRFYIVAAHYRSHVEFSFEALEEAAKGFGRIEDFLDRAGEPGAAEQLPGAFVAAMDDDLGTPAAVAVIHEHVREGNRLLGAGESAFEVGRQVRAMLDVLGLDPADPAWGRDARDSKLEPVVDALVLGLLAARAEAREDKDWARADAIRDQLSAAGITIEDTPTGPKWSV
jgi:cysteinyl-tRNA synthetase